MRKISKIIVITGVSRGLGLTMTEGFIGARHTVLGCARSAAAIEKLHRQHGPPAPLSIILSASLTPATPRLRAGARWLRLLAHRVAFRRANAGRWPRNCARFVV